MNKKESVPGLLLPLPRNWMPGGISPDLSTANISSSPYTLNG